MKRRLNHPDQLSLSLGFIRRIECSLGVKIFSDDPNGMPQSESFSFGEIPQNEGIHGGSGKNLTFGQSLARERKRRGFTQSEAAEILLSSRATVERWESGKTIPKPATQEGAIHALRASRRSPGKAKLDQVGKIHHLDWEKGKGWRLRVTFDVGQKVVGKRISLRLGTYALDEALYAKKVTLNLLRKLGLTVRQRTIKRAAKPAPAGVEGGAR